ncbi:MAG TPA: ABC transporter substrate-binding protein [Candidatus Saccharimonadales bacterium]|nr:ABC transporter substrate-binding protein [Candidatus Saccharimonadales bacterium]
MVIIRKRLIFWLIKAYIKKSKKILIFSFLAGLLVFFAILFGSRYLKTLFSLHRYPVIGIVGTYEKNNLPLFIKSKLSRGLTRVEADGSVKLDLAQSYKITDHGKTYTFKLDPNAVFADGKTLESSDLNYNFSDVKIETPNKNAIVFRLKDTYAPFLSTVSQPVFKSGLIGIGDYFIKNIQLNGNFVQSLTLSRNNNRFETIKLIFYPTETALKDAFMLGEVTEAEGLRSAKFKSLAFQKFPKVTVLKTTDYSHLVTLFYATDDKILSDKKMRLALSYALPNEIEFGEKAYLPYSSNSIYFNSDITERSKDIDHAKLLLPNNNVKLTITTLRKYNQAAKVVADSWTKIGVKTDIKVVDEIPDRFQVFLSDFNVPKDSDQYSLWHSNQVSNITKYKNVRIDKLLEDGRKTTDINERKKIYLDFQKFLIEDMPATFLYFPYEYDISRTNK